MHDSIIGYVRLIYVVAVLGILLYVQLTGHCYRHGMILEMFMLLRLHIQLLLEVYIDYVIVKFFIGFIVSSHLSKCMNIIKIYIKVFFNLYNLLSDDYTRYTKDIFNGNDWKITYKSKKFLTLLTCTIKCLLNYFVTSFINFR